MAKKTSGGSGKKENPSSKSAARRKVSSLQRRVKLLRKTASSALAQADAVKKKSAGIYRAADSAHRTAESVHEDIRTAEAHVAGAGKRLDSISKKTNKPFLIVGIGASAGGYEAFSQLLETISHDTGMAFVLVQHLDPKHESNLVGLLSKATSIPIAQATQELAVRPDHIYVIPPNTTMTIASGALKLAPRGDVRGLHLPIDHFLGSQIPDGIKTDDSHQKY